MLCLVCLTIDSKERIASEFRIHEEGFQSFSYKQEFDSVLHKK